MTHSSVQGQASAIFLLCGAIILQSPDLPFHNTVLLSLGHERGTYQNGLPQPSSVRSEERLSFMTAAAAVAVAMEGDQFSQFNGRKLIPLPVQSFCFPFYPMNTDQLQVVLEGLIFALC